MSSNILPSRLNGVKSVYSNILSKVLTVLSVINAFAFTAALQPITAGLNNGRTNKRRTSEHDGSVEHHHHDAKTAEVRCDDSP